MFLDQESFSYQTHENVILREMNKAWVGFQGAEHSSDRCVVTGKWGCGAFRGDAELKFVIQWLAASRCHRSMLFCGFHDPLLAKIPQLVDLMKGKTIAFLFKRLLQFTETKSKTGLFVFLLS